MSADESDDGAFDHDDHVPSSGEAYEPCPVVQHVRFVKR